MPIVRDPTAQHETGWRWRAECKESWCSFRSDPLDYGSAELVNRQHEAEHIEQAKAERAQIWKDGYLAAAGDAERAAAEIWEAGVLAGLQRSQGGNPVNPYG
jgi:hypothetical protein